MINVPASMLLTLPQNSASGVKMALPWPTGSLVSVQVLQQKDPGMATLMMAGQRVQAQVPGFLPLGNLWLQLMERGLQTQFRLLSDARAAEILAERLAAAVTGGDLKQNQQQLLRQHQEWPMPSSQQSQAGFNMQASANGNMLLLEDKGNGSPKGMVQKSENKNRSVLHGRVDLEHLGTVFFAVEKSKDHPYQLKLRVREHRSFISLQSPFSEWLKRLASDRQNQIESSSIQGRLSEGDEPIINPALGLKRVA